MQIKDAPSRLEKVLERDRNLGVTVLMIESGRDGCWWLKLSLVFLVKKKKKHHEDNEFPLLWGFLSSGFWEKHSTRTGLPLESQSLYQVSFLPYFPLKKEPIGAIILLFLENGTPFLHPAV